MRKSDRSCGRAERILSTRGFYQIFLSEPLPPLTTKNGGAVRLSFTARIERGPSEGARSASKKDDLAASYHTSFSSRFPSTSYKGGLVESNTARMERPRRSPPVEYDRQTWGFREHLDQPDRPCPILLSVPFHNRSIFPLCLITISPVTTTANETKAALGRISAAIIGKSPKAVSAPPEE